MPDSDETIIDELYFVSSQILKGSITVYIHQIECPITAAGTQ